MNTEATLFPLPAPVAATMAPEPAAGALGAAVPADDALRTPGEMAAIYKVQKSTFLQWFHAGRIPAEVAIGKILRFDAGKVAKALAKQARAVQKLNQLEKQS